VKLTQPRIATLSLEAGQTERFEWDDDLKGFGIRIRPTKRVWVIQYRHGTKQRRLTLADVDKLDAAKARKIAKDRLAAAQLGRDPQAEKTAERTRASITLGPKIDDYLAIRRKELRETTMRALEGSLKGYWRPLHGMELHRITKADVAARVTELRHHNGDATALASRGMLNAFFVWAIGEGLCDQNPVIGTNKPKKSKSRNRVLEDHELRTIWNALPTGDYGLIVKLAILTGARRHELGGMTWSELDLPRRVWAIPLARLKQHRAFDRLKLEDHKIPLSNLAVEIIRSVHRRAGRDLLFGAKDGRPFIGFGDCKARLDTRITEMTGTPLDPWTLHDFRRTIATQMQDKLKVLPHIADEVLGHIGPHKAGVQGTYNRATYWPEIVKAMALWGEHVRSVIEDTAPRVIALPAKRA